jgi:hypothetical protein
MRRIALSAALFFLGMVSWALAAPTLTVGELVKTSDTTATVPV